MSLTVQQLTRLVAMVDGVDIQLLDPSGRALAKEDPVPGVWRFVRPAPDTWDLRRWELERIRRPLKGCRALVNPEWGDPTPGTWKLGRARETSYVRVRDTIEDDLILTRDQWIAIHDRNHPVEAPPRPGLPGQGVLRDGGVAIWLGSVQEHAWIEVMSAERRSPNPRSSGYSLEYLTDLGKIPVPSGALRIAATAEDSHTDITGRRIGVTVGFDPGTPFALHVYVDRT